MRNKKKASSQKTAEQEALERRVDAMMDPKKPDETPAAAIPSAAAEKAKTPKASKVTKTAPQLSAKLRKQIGVDDAPAKPLSINKLDEPTESAATPTKPADPPPQDGITEQTDLDDSRTDEAVDDIVSYEGDVMLAIADSTVAERNRQAGETSEPKRAHGAFSAIIWTLVFLIAVTAVILSVLLVTGGNLPGPLKQ
jgi:hypothetical protein